MKQITERAYAKINLSLDVTAKRENGYHELDGVMQTVTLCDDVTVTYKESPTVTVTLQAEGNPDMPTDGRNLAVKAATRFLESVGRGGEVSIHIRKRIPMAGGLAGGSADAAAVLRALNRLTEADLSEEALSAIGVRLGADVPFCIMGGTMRTLGIGDRLEVLPPMPNCHIVITRRGEGVSTPWAYGKLDEMYDHFAEGHSRPASGLSSLLLGLETGSLTEVCGAVYNLFEPVVSACQSDVQALRGILLENGALVARMSGSGPSVFGIFGERESAECACRRLIEAGAVAHLSEPMNESLLG